MNDKGVYRTVPATQGLLKIIIIIICNQFIGLAEYSHTDPTDAIPKIRPCIGGN